MATTPEIKTRLTLAGLKEAATGLRGFARLVSDALSGARRGGGNTFEPMGRSLKESGKQGKNLSSELKKTKKEADSLSKAILKLGAKGTWGGVKIGALGAGTAFIGLKAKITSVSAAAIKASKDSAASLKSISIDAQRIGGSTSDVAVLGYAADITGTDRDELVTQIATISNEFLTLRENIQKAQGQYGEFLSMTAKEAAVAKRFGNSAGLKDVISGFSAADLEARKASITNIEARIAQIDADMNQIYASGDRRDGLFGDAARLQLQKERQELQEAAEQFRNSQSPQGQALFELQKFGIDIDSASKGGVESLLAIADAFQKIENPSQRARVAMRLFGEDSGVKLIPLLAGGRKAIDEYRETLEKSGAIASKSDIARAEEYSRAVLNLKAAFAGLQLTVGRALWPDLTNAAQELTSHVIRSREEIAQFAVEAFRDTRVFAEDALSLFSGETDNIQTTWLDSLVKKTIVVRDLWADVHRQVKLLWEGKDSDYGWLNTLRDAFAEVKKFAVDAWSVVTGGNAQNFQWLNSARDHIVAFASRLSDAFGMLKDLLGGIADFFRPVFEYFGYDVATFGLFIGLTKMLGLFGTLTVAARLFGKALGGVFALAGGALAAGRAVAGVGGAAGAASATATGLTSSLLTVGTTISTIVKGAALLGTSLAAGFSLGQQAAAWFFKDVAKAYDEVHKQQAEVIKAQAQPYLNGLLRERGTDRSRAFQKDYYGRDGVDIGWQGMTTEDRIAAGREQFRQRLGINMDPAAYSGRVYGGDVIGDSIRKRSAQQPAAVFKYDIKINGSPASVTGDMDMKRALDELNNGFS